MIAILCRGGVLYASTPVINQSSVSASASSPASAVVIWTTDIPATSQVVYGTNSTYGSSTMLDTTLVISHSVILSNLAPSTVYHYEVESDDGNGNLSTLGDFTFVTPATGPGIPIANGSWMMVLTHGLPAATNAWEQLIYAGVVHRSIMLSIYHQLSSEPDESLVGYNFDTNSWDVIDSGGNFHTENLPEGGESIGNFDYNPNNSTLVYHCCLSGSNQPEDIRHDWWYDLLGQSGQDRQTSPKPPFLARQPAGAFNPAYNKFVMQGGGSLVGTWMYDPVANAWQKMNPAGTLPNPSLVLPAMAYCSMDQKLYLFGGLVGSSFYSDIYTYDIPTNTWTLITPANGVKPSGRYRMNFAYDSTNNIFLLYGGTTASGVVGDTWVFDPIAETWTELNPPQSPGIFADFSRLAYDSDHNAFVLAHRGRGGYFGGTWTSYAIQTWLFRYAGSGPNPGNLSPTASVMPGGINRNPQGWGNEPFLTGNGNSAFVEWSEIGSPFDSSNARSPNIYISQYSNGGWVPVGTTFVNTSSMEAHQPSMAIIANTPWASWSESPDIRSPQIAVKSWNGSAWQGGYIGQIGNPGFQSRSQLFDVGGSPYIAFLEINKSTSPQSANAYVKSWDGTTWNLVGSGPVNRSTAIGTTAASISAASDGTYPYIAWTEYNRTIGSTDRDTSPQVYVSQWNGSRWVALGGSLNVNPANWAYDAYITLLNLQPYVAWTERSLAGNAQLYVSTLNGSGWVLVSAESLNQGGTGSWAYRPSLVADSVTGSLYLAWVEQTALGQKAQVYVSKYYGGSWTLLGSSLNIDTINGSAQRVSIGLLNGNPVVAWGEVNLDSVRQIYVKQWNGANWVQLSGVTAADTIPPTTPTSLTASAISANHINLSWASSNDNVGVSGYHVYRNGSLVGDATSNLAYQDFLLSPYTTYSYTVAAFDAAGNISTRSAIATATTLPTTQIGIASLTLTPSSVTGGGSTTANNVTLTGPAPSGGAVVSLTASDPSVTVPASVTISGGATVSPAFTITTSPVAANLVVGISATYNGVTKSATLTVTPATLTVVTLSPASVVGGGSTTANTVLLNGPAPSGGAVVSLTASDPSVTVPASVTISGGATVSPTFTITTSPVAANLVVRISATYNGVTKSATLTVTPAALTVVTLSPASVVGGGSTTANTVLLNGPAPSGGAVVSLTASDPSVTVPASVTISGGATVSPTFTITTSPVAANLVVRISATYNGVTKSSTLKVTTH